MIDLKAPSRRELLLTSGVLFAWANLPKAALAEGRDPRFLAIVLRGALDGLAAVAPVGDPEWLKLRGEAALSLNGKEPALPLDGFFALNPAMPNLHRMYKAGQAIIVHATATPYRERSHFDGQDVLESGQPGPGIIDSGWLNRALTAIAPAERVTASRRPVLAIGATAPLIVRGPAHMVAWAPSGFPPATDNTLARLLDLYRHTDRSFATALEERTRFAAMAAGGPKIQLPQQRGERVREHFARAAGSAARLLSQPGGPRVGALAFDGWDTHVNEGTLDGQLATLLAALDDSLGAIRTRLGPAWGETVVAVMTEFGRTAAINGTFGTDHGTATIAVLAGGALKGGRVIADWPGLAPTQLYEGRDLKPTTDLRAPLKGLLRDHLSVPDTALTKIVFPGSQDIRPMPGLVA